jgi:hypothetical protein
VATEVDPSRVSAWHKATATNSGLAATPQAPVTDVVDG